MPPPRYQPPATTPCTSCGRPFVDGRRQEHEKICARLASRRRTAYDSQQHRLEGTEHEPVYRRVQHMPETPLKENRWRQRHEELVTAVRAARQAQAHLAAGGRAQDLPPPPPSDYSDYIQCPHCQRKFNQTAAERHIPRCQFYEHNKPGPATTGRGRTAARQTGPRGRGGGSTRSEPIRGRGRARAPDQR